jgi:WD40 repeat protein
VASGQEVRAFEGHTGGVEGCAFSPDGRLALSAARDGTLRLWDVASGKEIAHWYTDAELLCGVIRSDGHLVAAGDQRGGFHILEMVGFAEPTQHRQTARLAPIDRLEASSGDARAIQAGRRRRWWPFKRL